MVDQRRWGYLQVMCRSEGGVDVVYRINGQDLAETQKQKVTHFLEAAGVGGWELVGVAGHGDDYCTSLWFKRPIN